MTNPYASGSVRQLETLKEYRAKRQLARALKEHPDFRVDLRTETTGAGTTGVKTYTDVKTGEVFARGEYVFEKPTARAAESQRVPIELPSSEYDRGIYETKYTSAIETQAEKPYVPEQPTTFYTPSGPVGQAEAIRVAKSAATMGKKVYEKYPPQPAETIGGVLMGGATGFAWGYGLTGVKMAAGALPGVGWVTGPMISGAITIGGTLYATGIAGAAIAERLVEGEIKARKGLKQGLGEQEKQLYFASKVSLIGKSTFKKVAAKVGERGQKMSTIPPVPTSPLGEGFDELMSPVGEYFVGVWKGMREKPITAAATVAGGVAGGYAAIKTPAAVRAVGGITKKAGVRLVEGLNEELRVITRGMAKKRGLIYPKETVSQDIVKIKSAKVPPTEEFTYYEWNPAKVKTTSVIGKAGKSYRLTEYSEPAEPWTPYWKEIEMVDYVSKVGDTFKLEEIPKPTITEWSTEKEGGIVTWAGEVAKPKAEGAAFIRTTPPKAPRWVESYLNKMSGTLTRWASKQKMLETPYVSYAQLRTTPQLRTRTEFGLGRQYEFEPWTEEPGIAIAKVRTIGATPSKGGFNLGFVGAFNINPDKPVIEQTPTPSKPAQKIGQRRGTRTFHPEKLKPKKEIIPGEQPIVDIIPTQHRVPKQSVIPVIVPVQEQAPVIIPEIEPPPPPPEITPPVVSGQPPWQGFIVPFKIPEGKGGWPKPKKIGRKPPKQKTGYTPGLTSQVFKGFLPKVSPEFAGKYKSGGFEIRPEVRRKGEKKKKVKYKIGAGVILSAKKKKGRTKGILSKGKKMGKGRFWI